MSDSHRFVDGLEGMGSDYVRPRTKTDAGAAMSDSTRGTDTMTWNERTVLRILMLVARLLAPEGWAAEIKNLANYIEVHAPKEEARHG